MAKKVDAYIKLQVAAGQANPSPPVGPALGQHGVNIMDFCKAFNAQTQSVEQGLRTDPGDAHAGVPPPSRRIGRAIAWTALRPAPKRAIASRCVRRAS